MYCVFKESLVTQKSPTKNEELYKKATKQCVLSYVSTEYGFNQYHAFTECMGWRTVSKRTGVEQSVIIGN